MSWSDYDALITTVLTNNGYAEIPENKLPDSASSNFKHKGYTLQWIGFGGVNYLSSDGMDYMNKVKLEIGYANKTPDLRDINAQLFISLTLLIKDIAGFHSFTSDPAFTDYGDSFHTKGVFEFLIGVECSC
jgi:hypothetical protein